MATLRAFDPDYDPWQEARAAELELADKIEAELNGTRKAHHLYRHGRDSMGGDEWARRI